MMFNSSTKHSKLLVQHERLFRGFIKDFGRVKLRRLLFALEKNHTPRAISHQLELPLDDIKLIYKLFRYSA
jgi:hypothetical protein